MLTTLAVENYRSLRDIVLPLRRLTVVTGANGTGKSSLYRALRLLADAARNGAVAALAYEGGLPSTLWAGPETVGRAVREGRHPVQGTMRTKPVALRLGFAGHEFGYAIDFGLPIPSTTKFSRDPEIKRECVWTGPVLRPAALITTAATRTQLIVVSHSAVLIRSLTAAADELGQDFGAVELTKQFGETMIVGQGRFDGPAWHWPKR